MKVSFWLVVAAAGLMSGCSSAGESGAANIAAAVADETRLESHRQRAAARRPARNIPTPTWP